MANAGNTGTRKNNNAKSTTSTGTVKKPRTAAQAKANQARSEKAQEVYTWLESHGIKKIMIYATKYKALKKAGKSDDEILEVLRAMQGENNAKKATNKTAKKAVNNVKIVKSNGTIATKRNIATQRQKNLAKQFANAGIKWVGPSQTYFKEKKKEGMSNNDIITMMKKEKPEFSKNAPPIPRTKRATAPTASLGAIAPLSLTTNAGVPKGSYVCEKCRFVANEPAANKPVNVNKPANVSKPLSISKPVSPPALTQNDTSFVEESSNVEELS